MQASPAYLARLEPPRGAKAVACFPLWSGVQVSDVMRDTSGAVLSNPPPHYLVRRSPRPSSEIAARPEAGHVQQFDWRRKVSTVGAAVAEKHHRGADVLRRRR